MEDNIFTTTLSNSQDSPRPEYQNSAPRLPDTSCQKIEDSKLMKSLNDYNIIPSEKIKRKLDFFYLPYNPIMHT